MDIYCLDKEKNLVTKFNCTCAPSGIKRHEFSTNSDDVSEIIAKGKELNRGNDVTLCEHF